MLRFTDTQQHYPPVQPAVARAQDFAEIYAGFNPPEAAQQSSRCSQCGIPFCQIHCPLQNNIPDWLKLTAEGRLREAYAISSATNTFPEICGRICPQDRLCEGNCVIEKDFGAVTIGAVEKFITEHAFEQGWVEGPKPSANTGKKVAIIGAGPAGLAAADMLCRLGHEVHVYDRYNRVGGLLIYGIPNFKLDKSVVARREALLRAGGIQFHLNHAISSLKDMRAKHDAVLIATGVYQAKIGNMLNADIAGVVPALTYLTASNRSQLGDMLEHAPSAAGKKVIVIGGGDTAMDCVRTAIRQGAASVTCLYRRDRANMPGSAREVKNAEEEGVHFEWLAAPLEILGEERVEAVRVQRMRLLARDATGRQAMQAVEGEEFTAEADMVIEALGYNADDLPRLWGEPELAVSKHGTLAIDAKTFETALPGVFAAGDIVRGASLVVWAIRDGRDASAAMHHFLINQHSKKAA